MKAAMASVVPAMFLAFAAVGCGNESDTVGSPHAMDDTGASETDGPSLSTGEPFMCGACKCDGRVAYCQKVILGPFIPGQWDDAPDGDVCPLGLDGGVSCVPYGPDCGSSPSCGCIHPLSCSPSQIAHGCFERDGAVGFEIRCGAAGP